MAIANGYASLAEAKSIQEEYQASNEELLSSKEELQSLNEELTSLNAELHGALNPAQQIIKIVNEELVATLGGFFGRVTRPLLGFGALARVFDNVDLLIIAPVPAAQQSLKQKSCCRPLRIARGVALRLPAAASWAVTKAGALSAVADCEGGAKGLHVGTHQFALERRQSEVRDRAGQRQGRA